MRVFLIPIILLLSQSAPMAWADPLGEQGALEQEAYDVGAGSITPTPEMWLYLQQQRRYDDPKLAIRRKAEVRAAQRRNRIAAMKWFGLSNQRPRANPTPWFGVYSPMWAAGLWEPYRWVGSGWPVLVSVTGRYASSGGP